MAFSPDGARIAIVTGDDTVSIVRTADGETEQEIKSYAFSLNFSDDGSRLLLIGRDRRKLYDMRRRAALNVVGQLLDGYTGVRLDQKNGKLLIDSVVPDGPVHQL